MEIIKFVMEQRGFQHNDLALLFGSRPRASEVLAGKRRLTIEMIVQLSRDWGIPSDLLIA